MSTLTLILLLFPARKARQEMKDLIVNYLRHLRIENNASPQTLYQYRLELEKFTDSLVNNNIYDVTMVTTSMIRDYIQNAAVSRNLKPNSIGKAIAVLKSYFRFLYEEDIIGNNRPG